MSPILFRKSFNLLGILRVNFSKTWPPSLTWHVGPWSWNTRTRAHRVDLPGPLSYRSPARRRRSR